jgi:hypothetical protein
LFFLISNLVRNILFRWRTKMSTIPVWLLNFLEHSFRWWEH